MLSMKNVILLRLEDHQLRNTYRFLSSQAPQLVVVVVRPFPLCFLLNMLSFYALKTISCVTRNVSYPHRPLSWCTVPHRPSSVPGCYAAALDAAAGLSQQCTAAAVEERSGGPQGVWVYVRTCAYVCV
jgi:hypothetical protein